jgi:hypothetical protein
MMLASFGAAKLITDQQSSTYLLLYALRRVHQKHSSVGTYCTHELAAGAKFM